MGKGSWAASPPSPGSSINAINEHTYTAKAAFPRSQQRPEGNLYQIGTGAAMVYDSFGRRVEQSGAEILYGPDGSKLALMSGQSVTRAFAPLPGAPALGAGFRPRGTSVPRSPVRLFHYFGGCCLVLSSGGASGSSNLRVASAVNLR